MAHSFSNLIYHVVFATKGRFPWLTGELLAQILDHFGAILQAERCFPLAMNGMPEHVHLLVKTRPDQCISDLVGVLKSHSSGRVHRGSADLAAFAWQTGYGAFSVSQSQVEVVRDYIARQEEHHRTHPFDAEFRTLLRKNGIMFDEQALWE